MNFTKQITSVLLVILLAFYAGGYLALFNWQQNLIREEIREKILSSIPGENLVLLKIPLKVQSDNPSVFKRMHEREFRYQGQLYDIVNEEQVGKTTWFYCIHDKQETRLVSRLSKIKKKDGNNNPIDKNRSQILEHLVLSPFDIDHKGKIHKTLFVTNLHTAYFFSLKLWTEKPQLPPPKV